RDRIPCSRPKRRYRAAAPCGFRSASRGPALLRPLRLRGRSAKPPAQSAATFLSFFRSLENCAELLGRKAACRYIAPQQVSGIGRLGDHEERDAMQQLLTAYMPLVIFIGVSAAIGLALLIAPFIVAYRNPDPEKLSAYECGFNAFDDARMKFDVRFYLVSILFIIFDLEVAFLFPWTVVFG